MCDNSKFFYTFINGVALNISKLIGIAHPHSEGKFTNIISLFGILLAKGLIGEKYKDALTIVEDGEKVAPKVEDDVKDLEEIIHTVEEIDHAIHPTAEVSNPTVEPISHSTSPHNVHLNEKK